MADTNKISNPKNIFYLNKESFEYETINTAADLSELIKLYEEVYKPKGKIYIVIDEVQNIKTKKIIET